MLVEMQLVDINMPVSVSIIKVRIKTLTKCVLFLQPSICCFWFSTDKDLQLVPGAFIYSNAYSVDLHSLSIYLFIYKAYISICKLIC